MATDDTSTVMSDLGALLCRVVRATKHEYRWQLDNLIRKLTQPPNPLMKDALYRPAQRPIGRIRQLLLPIKHLASIVSPPHTCGFHGFARELHRSLVD